MEPGSEKRIGTGQDYVPEKIRKVIAKSNWKDGEFIMLRPAKYYEVFDFPEDEEELALTLDGKKKHINRQSFVRAMASSGLGDKVIEKIFRKFMDAASKWYDFIDASFLPVELKEKYKEEIRENLGKLQEA